MCTVNLAVAGIGSMLGSRGQGKAAAASGQNFAAALGLDMESFGVSAERIADSRDEALGEREIDGARLRGRLMSVLGNTNLVGATTVRLRNEVALNTEKNKANIRRNAKNQIEDLEHNVEVRKLRYQQEIAGIRKPSPLGDVMNIFAAGINDKSRKLSSFLPENVNQYLGMSGGATYANVPQSVDLANHVPNVGRD